MQLTRAITHIRLTDANTAKLTVLDTLVAVYLPLCQQYVTAFCTDHAPDKFAPPLFASPLSARWQRVAIQQAAGIAQSWHTNRDRAHAAYQEDLAEYIAHPDEHLPAVLPAGCRVRVRFADGKTEVTTPDGLMTTYRTAPIWCAPRVPELKQPMIQANSNVVALEPSTDSSVDYWLRVSTLERGRPVPLPVKLAADHRAALAGHSPNSSTTLTHQPNGRRLKQNGWLVEDLIIRFATIS